MAFLSESHITTLLLPFLEAPVAESQTALMPMEELIPKLSAYLDVLLKWNARTNLTAIREPEEIVRRHFGESLFAGRVLASRLNSGATVLDFGSGAGFPGLPMALLLPEIRIVLAESQGKKAAFLQEAVRSLGSSAEVWAKRVEDLPEARLFDTVAMRAVDKMDLAVAEAEKRVISGGWLALLAGEEYAFSHFDSYALPGAQKRSFLIRRF